MLKHGYSAMYLVFICVFGKEELNYKQSRYKCSGF